LFRRFAGVEKRNCSEKKVGIIMNDCQNEEVLIINMS
jgi:hypothetical protein